MLATTEGECNEIHKNVYVTFKRVKNDFPFLDAPRSPKHVEIKNEMWRFISAFHCAWMSQHGGGANTVCMEFKL